MILEGNLVCPKCHTKNNLGSHYCYECGHILNNENKKHMEEDLGKVIEDQARNTFDSIVNKVSDMSGGSGPVKLHLSDLIINVFKKHTPEERDNIFICGTNLTTPDEKDISAEWPKPWLYSRILFFLSIVFIAFILLWKVFGQISAYPGIIFIGSLVVPFSLLVFFWEVNAPRNISIFNVVKIFFIGGVFSLLVTLFLNGVFYSGPLTYFGAIMIGIIEETGKIIVVAYFLRGKKEKYILNGLLIGATVGAGFAVFETAGYALNEFLNEVVILKNVNSYMLYLICMRGITSLGTHVVWTAMCGAALARVKGSEALSSNCLSNMKFLQFLFIAMILHAIWDMPFAYYLKYVILTVVAWFIVLIQINSGLKQIENLNK